MATGVHRSTSNSKAGRQMTSGGGQQFYAGLQPKETQQWNAAVDAKKADKKAAKKGELFSIASTIEEQRAWAIEADRISKSTLRG